jgi:hypothetical protein
MCFLIRKETKVPIIWLKTKVERGMCRYPGG